MAARFKAAHPIGQPQSIMLYLDHDDGSRQELVVVRRKTGYDVLLQTKTPNKTEGRLLAHVNRNSSKRFRRRPKHT